MLYGEGMLCVKDALAPVRLERFHCDGERGHYAVQRGDLGVLAGKLLRACFPYSGGQFLVDDLQLRIALVDLALHAVELFRVAALEHAHIVAGELKLVAQFAVFVLKRPDTVVCSMKLLLKEVCRLLGVLWDIHIRHGPGCPGLEGAGAI